MSLETRISALATRIGTECKGKAPLDHEHGIGDVTSLQTTLDAKAIRAANVLGSGLPWFSQAVVNSGALATGYNLMEGGIMADRPIVLESMVFWLETLAGTIGGTGNLQIQWYTGDVTTQGTLVHTTQIPAGNHDAFVVLGTPVNLDVNAVMRAYFTMGTTTVTVPCHIQWRGRYQ